MQKQTAILAAAMLLTAALPTHAEVPTSQFGYRGWPYRQETNCAEPVMPPVPTQAPVLPTAAATNTPASTLCPTEEPVNPTTPAPAPTEEAPAPTAAPGAQPTKSPSMDEDYTTVSISVQEQNAWNLLNSDRKSNGLSALALDPELSRLARLKSEDMRDKGYFAHESPTYGRVSDMLDRFGYTFTAAGENIAHHANITKAQAAFMSSEGHRRNILSSSWTKVGIGVCMDKNGYVYVTQIFVR